MVAGKVHLSTVPAHRDVYKTTSEIRTPLYSGHLGLSQTVTRIVQKSETHCTCTRG